MCCNLVDYNKISSYATWLLLLIGHLAILGTLFKSSLLSPEQPEMRQLHRRETLEMEHRGPEIRMVHDQAKNAVNSSLDLRLEKDSNQCPLGYYRLPEMESCDQWLACDDIEERIVVTHTNLGNGLGKSFSKASLDGVPVAFIRTREDKLTSEKIVNRVRLGFENLKMLQPHPRITQLLGYCLAGNTTVMITELGQYGDLRQFLLSAEYKEFTLLQRFDTALQVVEALEYVHESPGGSRINCDMNTVGQALAQFIVLSDYRVVLNDVDDLPSGDSRTNKKSQCVVGRSNINATADHSFEAPERRWPWPGKLPKQIDPAELRRVLKGKVEDYTGNIELKSPPVDEKSDVWKIPFLVEKVLTSGINVESRLGKRVLSLVARLKPLLEDCLEKKPEDRPSAKTVVSRLQRMTRRIEELGW